MIVRVAVVPHPPLLVPDLAAGATAETAPLRNSCLAAARTPARGCPRWIAVTVVDPAFRRIGAELASSESHP